MAEAPSRARPKSAFPVKIEHCADHRKQKKTLLCKKCGDLVCKFCPLDEGVVCPATGGQHDADFTPVKETDVVYGVSQLWKHVETSQAHLQQAQTLKAALGDTCEDSTSLPEQSQSTLQHGSRCR